MSSVNWARMRRWRSDFVVFKCHCRRGSRAAATVRKWGTASGCDVDSSRDMASPLSWSGPSLKWWLRVGGEPGVDGECRRNSAIISSRSAALLAAGLGNFITAVWVASDCFSSMLLAEWPFDGCWREDASVANHTGLEVAGQLMTSASRAAC